MTTLESALSIFPFGRIRRHHGIEHATLQVLAERFPNRALAGYCELQQRMAASQNVWMEFLALRKIIGMTKKGDDTGGRARTRVKELLAGIALHAESPAIKGSFQKFRNKWRRYVNDMST